VAGQELGRSQSAGVFALEFEDAKGTDATRDKDTDTIGFEDLAGWAGLI